MKKMFAKHSVLSLLLLILLIAATVGSVASCGEQESDGGETGAPVTFTLEVVFSDGSVLTKSVETTQKKVGAALLEQGLIAGEEGQYGLYIKTVCGETLDYDTHGLYWAFYVNGEYAMTGVDTTDVVVDHVYRLAAEK